MKKRKIRFLELKKGAWRLSCTGKSIIKMLIHYSWFSYVWEPSGGAANILDTFNKAANGQNWINEEGFASSNKKEFKEKTAQDYSSIQNSTIFYRMCWLFSIYSMKEHHIEQYEVCLCVLNAVCAHVSTLQLLNNNMGEGTAPGHVTAMQACNWLPGRWESCNWPSGNWGPKMTITKKRDTQFTQSALEVFWLHLSYS